MQRRNNRGINIDKLIDYSFSVLYSSPKKEVETVELSVNESCEFKEKFFQHPNSNDYNLRKIPVVSDEGVIGVKYRVKKNA